MAVTSNLNFALQFTGDAETEDNFSMNQNENSPGQSEVQDLISGDNVITVPTGGNSIAQVVIIIPPAANSIAMTLKGDAADVGIPLNLVNPTALAINALSSFIINASDAITGVRFIFV